MDKLRLCLCLIVFGLSLLHVAECSENETCAIAKTFEKPATPNDEVRVHCDSDKSCAGFHCRGVYLLDNAQLHIKKGDPVCFGAMINHCDTPLSMDVYFQSAFMKSAFQNRLHHNASLQIPGVTVKFNIITADMFIFVEMEHEDNKVTIALTAKVRYTLDKIEVWPETLNFQVIPEQTFPVPPCLPGESRNITPIPVFPSCVAPTNSETHGKPCDPSVLYQCGKNEMCTFNKTCDCSHGMVLNPYSGLCDTPGATPPPKPKLNPVATSTVKTTSVVSQNSAASAAPHKAVDDPKKSTSGLITGLAVGAVAVLGIVILISFLIWRSRTSSQFDHVPFVDNEEVVM